MQSWSQPRLRAATRTPDSVSLLPRSLFQSGPNPALASRNSAACFQKLTNCFPQAPCFDNHAQWWGCGVFCFPWSQRFTGYEPEATPFHTVAASCLSFCTPRLLFSASYSLFCQKVGGVGYTLTLCFRTSPSKSSSRRRYRFRRDGILDGGDAGVFRQQVLAVLDD
jgi:hypothetical protein